MHDITLHDAFVAEGCAGTAPRQAATIEAGALWLPTYNAVTTKAGRCVQGGGCATVGVAGLIQSGGFGSFSKTDLKDEYRAESGRENTPCLANAKRPEQNRPDTALTDNTSQEQLHDLYGIFL
jgi:hypothetical protein